MRTIKIFRNWKSALIATGVVAFIGLSSCDDNTSESTKGRAVFKVTDAAVDAEQISGVYLSVSEIQAKADGEVKTIITFDTPQAFDVMAYQNGETYLLGESEMEPGTYSDFRFIISGASDSYLMMKDGTKEALEIPSGTSSGYKLKGTVDVAANTTTELVADIDLRKALVTTGNGTYKLRPTARLVSEMKTGTIEGTVNGTFDASEQLVVYAYHKGEFDSSEEEAPAEGETRFQGSVNSAVVAEDGTYTLAFMESGEYELVVASYTNQDEDSDLEFSGRVNVSILIGGVVFDQVEVTSDATTTVNLSIL